MSSLLKDSSTNGFKQGVIRFCNIDSYDCNACCGTQCPHLSLCGSVHVIPPSCSPTSTKPSSMAPTKLYFVAGPRAIAYTQQASKQISTTAQSLGINRGEVVERVVKLDTQRIEVLDREKGLRAELSTMLGEKAVESVSKNTNRGIVWIHREQKSTNDFDFLGSIGSYFLASTQNAAEVVPVIISTSALPGVTPSLLMVQSRDNDLAKKVSESLKMALEGIPNGTVDGKGGRVKGGGAKGRYMSKVDGKWGQAEMLAVTKALELVSATRYLQTLMT